MLKRSRLVLASWAVQKVQNLRVAFFFFLQTAVCVCSGAACSTKSKQNRDKKLQSKRILSDVITLQTAILKSNYHYQANYPIIRQH